MKNKELLLKAVGSYDVLTANQRVILKVLIEFSDTEVVTMTIRKIHELSGISKPSIYKALDLFEESGIIRQQKKQGSKKTSFVLSDVKLNKIITHYNTETEVIKKYSKNN